jgi:hypothetical protein
MHDMKGMYFVLLPNRMIAEVGMKEWAEWYQDAERTVAQTETELHLISTVFLGINHQFSFRGPPLLFETMVFAKDGNESSAFDGECRRYSSWDDAEAGHKTVTRRVLKAEAEAAASIKNRRGD